MENIIDVFCFDFTVIYTIEFQKCGLPHAHILIFLHPQFKHPNPDGIDKIISAELLDEQVEPELFKIVSSFMIHGPCGIQNKNFLHVLMIMGSARNFFRKFFAIKPQSMQMDILCIEGGMMAGLLKKVMLSFIMDSLSHITNIF